MNASLSHRAMLARISVAGIDFRKLDKRVSAEVNTSKGAAANASRTNKLLIESPLLAEIKKVEGEIRAKHRFLTLPWQDDGYRMLPASAFNLYRTEINILIRKFEAAVSAFVAVYPDLIEESKQRLGEMFDYADFPHQKTIAKRFNVACGTMPLPEGKDFRVDLGDEQVAAIRGEIEGQAEAALAKASKDLWGRLHGVIARMSERLGAFRVNDEGKQENGFKNSLVSNIEELVAILPALNITNDPVLTDLTNRARAELCLHDAPVLKQNDRLREKVKASADDILSALVAYTGFDPAEASDEQEEAA